MYTEVKPAKNHKAYNYVSYNTQRIFQSLESANLIYDITNAIVEY